MANLLDTIRQTSGDISTQKAGVEDNTAEAQRLLAAKKGKASTSGDVAASNLGEQQAVAQTNQQMMGTVAPEAAAQQAEIGQQAAGQEQQQQAQEQQIAQSARFNSLQNNIQTKKLLDQLEQSKGQLDVTKQKAATDQVAQGLRLGNAQYIDTLQREGARQRLDDSQSFQEALTKANFGDAQEQLQQKMGDQSILAANDRTYKQAMAKMDANLAYQIFGQDMSAEQQKQLYSSMGGLAQSGIGAYGKYADKQDAKKAADNTSLDKGEYNPEWDTEDQLWQIQYNKKLQECRR